MWGYGYYLGRRQVGAVSSNVGPTSTVRISGAGIDWYSTFNIDTPIIPGVCRHVYDNRTGAEVYRIVYWQPGVYELQAESSLLAEERNSQYLFGTSGMPVTALTERISTAEWIPPNNLEIEPYFLTTVFDEIRDEPLMAMLSFPALRFC